jgi:hypothetical protein
MSGYGFAYTPYRINYKHCNTSTKQCPKISVGELYDAKNDSDSTAAMKYKNLVKLLYIGRGSARLRYVNKNLNAFRRYSGAHGGFGAAPKNTF